jgi:hypothetical protein
VFGLAALAYGVITLAWPGYYDWLALHWSAPASLVFAYAASAAQIVGGAAITFRRTEKAGAAILSAVYLVIALLAVPRIVAAPRTYDPWGDFFEQFSLATGAAIAYARSGSLLAPRTLLSSARMLFSLCVASFALEQVTFLDATASLVPKWLPPSQMFWALATTVLFAFASLALLSGRFALLSTRLLTLMLVSFGVLVWVPVLFSDPHTHSNWTETAETFAIAGAAWILADLLGAQTQSAAT